MLPSPSQPPAPSGYRQRFTEDELEDLVLPPPAVGPIEVNYRLILFDIGKVETREQMATIRLGIALYWTDARMVGYEHPILPPTLWGPELLLRNAMGGVSMDYEQFVVLDSADGSMKRIINYEATVNMPMDLHTFPFDVQTLQCEWVSISHWRQLDGSRFGSLPKGQSYILKPVWRQTQGQFLTTFFDGRIPEWHLHSHSSERTCAKHAAGFTITNVSLKFHLQRKWQYYLIKVVAPLVVLTVGTHLVFAISCSELADRLSNVFSMYLAAFALLYVVGDLVPRVDFLSLIDRILFLTLLTLLWIGIESVAVHRYDEFVARSTDGEWLPAGTLDSILGSTGFGLYVLALLRYIVPAVWAQTAEMLRLEKEGSEAMQVIQDERLLELPASDLGDNQQAVSRVPVASTASPRGGWGAEMTGSI